MARDRRGHTPPVARPRHAPQLGTMLPRSEAPGIVRDREALEPWVRQAAMSAEDRDVLWAWVQCVCGRDDLPRMEAPARRSRLPRPSPQPRGRTPPVAARHVRADVTPGITASDRRRRRDISVACARADMYGYDLVQR